MKALYYAYAWLMARPALTKINNMIYGLALRGLGIYNYANSRISGEKWLINSIVKKLGNDLVIFDVGANVGTYTKEIISAGVNANVIYSFEPHPVTYGVLKSNLAPFRQVITVNQALSNENAKMKLFDRADEEGSSHASLSSEVFSEVHYVGTTSATVDVVTLDGFCAQKGIETIDFLKIDVEGYEINVLRGANTMLSERNIRVIQFEFTQLNSILGVFFKDIYDMLSKYYDIYRLLPHGLRKIKSYNSTMCEIFGYQNYVAILKDDKCNQ